VAAASHSRPKLAVAGRSSPERTAASLAIFTAKVNPFQTPLMPSSTLTQLLLFISFILVTYACSYMIYLYLCLCRAFALVYLLSYGYVLLLRLPFVLLVHCVFVLFVYGPSLRAGRGIVPRSNVSVVGFISLWP
jgi:hypothetical protein